MNILSKQFNYKINQLNRNSMKDNEVVNDEYNELARFYEDFRKKNKVFFKPKLIVFANNNIFSKKVISFVIRGTYSGLLTIVFPMLTVPLTTLLQKSFIPSASIVACFCVTFTTRTFWHLSTFS